VDSNIGINRRPDLPTNQVRPAPVVLCGDSLKVIKLSKVGHFLKSIGF
jgi:hypothetical protein